MNENNSIKKQREKLNLSRAQFAKLIGVSIRTVQGWEVGRAPSNTAQRLINSLTK